MMNSPLPFKQSGVMLLEALIAILIFSMGILALVGMQAIAVSSATDSKSRADASYLANQIIGQMWLENRPNAATLQANLVAYAHYPDNGGSACTPSGAASAHANVTSWLTKVTAALPGAVAAKQQIIVDTAANNLVTVRLCWQGPQDTAPRNFVVITNIN